MNESLFEPHFSFPSTFQREFQQRLSFIELDFYILLKCIFLSNVLCRHDP